MSSNTTTQAQPRTADEARIAWATADRDTELDRWQELYALAVPQHEPEAGQ